MIGYCGVNCNECPVYIATINDDDEARAKIAQEWSSEQYAFKAAEVNCDGCLVNDGALMNFCNDCTTRQCAISKGIENCAHCADFACENLQKHWKMAGVTEPKETLEKIHQNLN